MEMPDFLSMIDQQARMLVNLATTVGETLEGKESAHSVRLLDLEQRREELKRRNQAAVHSMLDLGADIDEIRGSMEALDRAAARLLLAARGLHQFWLHPTEAGCQMMAVIRNGTESLQHGYAQFTNGWSAAEFDADEAIASKDALSRYRIPAFPEILDTDDESRLPPLDQRVVNPDLMSVERTFWLTELYGNLDDIAQELACAGVILKEWSRRRFASLHDGRQEWAGPAPCDTPGRPPNSGRS
ncbi:hypothetical protein [Candidatus Accumulibacter aalborgensis]|nr:hypothetical protein [Candidatus Accumulibacter aalborgensis]